MKNLIWITAVFFCSLNAMAQSEKFTAAMKENIAAITPAFANPADLIALANKFERIATAEKTQWLPFYYSAYCQVNAALINADKSTADAVADKATTLINQAELLQPNNSEISCIKSMIATAHLTVDAMNRYMEYGPEIEKNLQAAIKQDPANPRPEMLIGQGLKFTPEQFGGGCGTALEKLEAAKTKFDSFKPITELHPNWGKEYNQQLIDDCKK